MNIIRRATVGNVAINAGQTSKTFTVKTFAVSNTKAVKVATALRPGQGRYAAGHATRGAGHKDKSSRRLLMAQ